MDAKELMIGDWVYWVKKEKKPVQVTEISRGCIFTDVVYPLDLHEIQPIPLTPKILSNNGFNADYEDRTEYTLKHKVDGYLKYSVTVNLAAKSCCTVYNRLDMRYYNGRIENVHELQHLLRMMGIEKEITL